MKYQEQVERGAEWLDSELPGWEHKIDLGTLNLARECRCVLGQLAVDLVGSWSWFADDPYTAVVDAVDYDGNFKNFKTRGNEVKCGFDLWGGSAADYVDLTEEWKRLIRKRRKPRERKE